MFLKYLDDLERANEQKAELSGRSYTYIIDKPHRWSAWAAPKKRDGTFDHDKALTGDYLIDFIHGPRGIRFGPFRLSLKQGPHADCVPEKN